jgi:peroxiredoxin
VAYWQFLLEECFKHLSTSESFRQMKLIPVIFAIALFLSIPALAQSSINVGSTAPVFSAVGLDGTTYDLAELRGSVVVVTFWSTKCEICRSEIPRLNQFAGRFDSKKVVFLALSMEQEDKLANYLRSNPFSFKIVPNSFGVVLQYANRSADGYVEMGFPTFFVIDQMGTVQYKASGYDKTEPLSTAINRLLAK